FATLLGRYANRQDVVVATPIANRTRPELEGLIGFFANTLALRTDLSGNPRVRELLARVREATVGAYDHQDVPFESVVDAVCSVRDRSYMPLAQVLFVLQNAPSEPLELPGLTVEAPPALETGGAKFDMQLYLAETGGGIGATLVYSTDLFEPTTASRTMT